MRECCVLLFCDSYIFVTFLLLPLLLLVIILYCVEREGERERKRERKGERERKIVAPCKFIVATKMWTIKNKRIIKTNKMDLQKKRIKCWDFVPIKIGECERDSVEQRRGCAVLWWWCWLFGSEKNDAAVERSSSAEQQKKYYFIYLYTHKSIWPLFTNAQVSN